MTARTIIVVGVSGVGKTTFITSLEEYVSFQFLSAGSLIKLERKRQEEEIHRDALRFADIADNQRLLIEGCQRSKDDTAGLVIIDGHTVIDTQDGIEPIPADVFRALEIEMFIFLEAEPQVILEQRASDSTRRRPMLPLEAIARHQAQALGATRKIADEMSVPFKLVTASDRDKLGAILQSWSNDSDERLA